MSNDGKALEKIVADLETLTLGKGFTVTPNDKVFDEDGNQIAEFDIKIEGKDGSTFFRWLIECRDRPSKGPAPSSWIQQLSGRRELFDFDKVIAVSTTGFSPGARKSARKLRVTLREVTSLEEISSEFGTFEWRLRSTNVLLRGIVDFDFPGNMLKKAMKLGSKIVDAKIRKTGEKKFLLLSQFIHREYLQNKQIQITPEPETDEVLEVVFEGKGMMELLVGRQILHIVGLSVPINLQYSFFPVSVMSVKSYGEDGVVIGEEAAFSAETPDAIIKFVVLITWKDGEPIVVQKNHPEYIPKH